MEKICYISYLTAVAAQLSSKYNPSFYGENVTCGCDITGAFPSKTTLVVQI